MKKIISIILTVAIVASMATTLTGCFSFGDQLDNVAYVSFDEQLQAEKVGTMRSTNHIMAETGIIYENEDGYRGVISYDGKHDTGAVFAFCQASEQNFRVAKTAASSYSDIAGLNSMGLIDAKGNVIVPYNYASFKTLNDRYVQAYTVTERTYIKDEALVYYTDDTFSFSADDDDVLFKGTWCVYDVINGKTVPGLTGSTDLIITAKGRYLRYNDAEYNTIIVDENGTALPEGAELFDDGTYSYEERVGTVYDEDGNVMFEYDLAGFVPSYVDGNYYKAVKYADGETIYVVMDKTGQIVSKEFTDSIDIVGNLVLCKDKVYNFNGENILEGDFTSVNYDLLYGNCYIANNYDTDISVIFKENGAILYQAKETDDLTVYNSEFVASKKIDGNYMYFSHKDKDYTIKGYSVAPWLVKVSDANGIYDLVDTISGENVLEGYTNYSSKVVNGTTSYILASYKGGMDVFRILSRTQLAAVKEKKTKLLNDLVAAFDTAGIKVTVDQETGELAMDSSVLFGGDSAELTSEGKAFLNKFIGVYTTTIFSPEYDGFVSKTMVEGHTAPVAGSTYESGLELSEQRAANVKAYCLSAETGADVSKLANALEDIGYSNSKPVYTDSGSVDMAASRRVSFSFYVDIDGLGTN